MAALVAGASPSNFRLAAFLRGAFDDQNGAGIAPSPQGRGSGCGGREQSNHERTIIEMRPHCWFTHWLRLLLLIFYI